MATRIQIRRDTAANWSSANTILAQGEMALETDTGKLKVGDGTTTWTALDYSLDPAGATGRVSSADNGASTKLYSPTANVVLEPGTGGTVVANGNMTVNGSFDASDVGTYTGSVITDNQSLQGALQQLETAVEAAEESSEFAGLAGVGTSDTNLGTFSGSTISDNGSIKAGMQELETAVETKLDASAHTQASLSVDHLITLSGVADSADDLGTFTGSTITDNSTVKTALQELETAVELAEESTQIGINTDNINDINSAVGTSLGATNVGTFTGSTISDNGTVKAGMQELETAVEARATSASLATVATTGAYSDISGTPTLATVATSGAYSDLSGTPTLATVATTGAYSDITGTPTLATVATTGAYSDVTGTPTLATVATSGSYADLTNKPTSFADLTITGNLVVQGAQTTLDTAVLDVEDINITIAKDSPNAASSNGAGITVDGPTTKPTILYNDNPEKWVFNKTPYFNSDRILTTADEGTGNGLDADTLDGQEGTHYLDYGNFTNTPTIPTASSLDVDDLQTLSGVAGGSTNLGTFTGSTIADNQTIKASLQALETAVEAAEESTAITGVYTGILGVSDGDADLGTFTGSTIADSRDVKEALQDLETKVETKLDTSAHTKASLDVDHIINTLGTGAVNDDMGTFTGSTIADNQTVKQAIQALETAVESAEESTAITGVYTGILGVSDGDANFGTFTGSTIADNQDAKEALQALETAVETKLASADVPTKASLDVDHLITLSGVSAASDDLGTFTGSTIADNSTIKASLQALETAVELAEETSDINTVYTGALGLSAGDPDFGTFSGSIIADNSDAKEAFQVLETAVESKLDASAVPTQASLSVDHIITLSGVAESSDHLGTFTGSAIADNETIKGALQDLEDAIPTKASLDVDHLITLSGVADASDNLGTFTGATIADNETIKGALQDLETALELNATLASDETITGNYTFNELISGVGIKSSGNDSKMTLSATTNEGGSNIVMSAGENIHFLSDRNANDGDGSICFHFNDSHDTSLAVADAFWKMDETGILAGKDATTHIQFPSWTTTERDNGSFSAGAVIFNSTTSKLQVYDGSSWVDLH